MDECQGAFDKPVARDSKCDACGLMLKDHSWYPEIFETS